LVLTTMAMRRHFFVFCLVLMTCYTVAAQKMNDGRGVRPAAPSGSIASHGVLAHNNSLETRQSKIVSLCTQDEKTIWSCETTGRKIVSICGSRELNKERGYLQYRFGRPGRVELEYPRQRQNTQTAFSYFRYTRPLVTYLGLRFQTGGYDYEVYDNSNEEAGAGGSEAGVTVTPTGNTARTVDYRCRKPVVHHLIELEEVVPNTEMTPGGP
jgi:hypothetical protein